VPGARFKSNDRGDWGIKGIQIGLWSSCWIDSPDCGQNRVKLCRNQWRNRPNSQGSDRDPKLADAGIGFLGQDLSPIEFGQEIAHFARKWVTLKQMGVIIRPPPDPSRATSEFILSILN
jgi:hypothetical protein